MMNRYVREGEVLLKLAFNEPETGKKLLDILAKTYTIYRQSDPKVADRGGFFQFVELSPKELS